MRIVRSSSRPRLRLERLEEREVPAVSILTNTTGLRFEDSNNSVPPDPYLAAGPTTYVQVVNTTVAIYDKATGNKLFQKSLASLFGTPGGFDIFDPLVTYDEQANRFVVSVLEESDAAQRSNLDFAILNPNAPAGSVEEIHRVATDRSVGLTRQWGDFPSLGWNADAYVVTLNLYNFDTNPISNDVSQGGNQGVEVISIDKHSVTDANSATLTAFKSFRDPSHFTMAVATMHGSTPGGPMYFVEEGSNGDTRNQINVIRMTNVLSNNPTFSDHLVQVDPYTDTVNVPQLGGGDLEPNDTRFANGAEWRDNRLVTAHSIGTPNGTKARFYEFSTAGTPALRQQITIDPGPGIATFYPDIAIAPNGDLGATFARSAANELLSTYVTGQRANDPLGFLRPPVLLRSSDAAYTGPDQPPFRTGDYASVSVDPATASFWITNEIATSRSGTNWGTSVGQFVLDNRPAPTGIYAVGAGPGGGPQVNVYSAATNALLSSFNAFDLGFTGGVRVATADVTGDGIEDIIVGAGPGGAPEVRVFDGRNAALIRDFMAYETTFTGGVFVAAADLDSDGHADIVTTPDQGGGARVRVFSGADGSVMADFLGIDDPNFRGGARVALGDLSGDRIPDLLVGAGFGGGPRVAGFDGRSLRPGQTPAKLFGDFFVFEDTLRNGVFLTSGDLNGDNFADVIVGAGPGGGPRVFALSGKDLTQNGGAEVQLANFFGGDVNNRGGIRVAAKNLDGDERIDLVTGAGENAPPLVTTYLGAAIPTNGQPPPEQQFFPFDPNFVGGVFVG